VKINDEKTICLLIIAVFAVSMFAGLDFASANAELNH
jgi:hypothetical protein